jgi:hypothetical protein
MKKLGVDKDVTKLVILHYLKSFEPTVNIKYYASVMNLPNVTTWVSDRITNYKYNKAFIRAIKKGNINKAKWIYGNCAFEPHDDLPVLIASGYGHLNILKWLVSSGIRIRLWDDAILMVATRAGHLPVVEWIFDQNITIFNKYYNSALEAARYGHLHIIEYINEFHRIDDLILNEAIKAGHLPILEWALANSYIGNLENAYDTAVRFGRDNITKLIKNYL